MASLCFDCGSEYAKSIGFKLEGVHTAEMAACSKCGHVDVILPARHYGYRKNEINIPTTERTAENLAVFGKVLRDNLPSMEEIERNFGINKPLIVKSPKNEKTPPKNR